MLKKYSDKFREDEKETLAKDSEVKGVEEKKTVF